MTDTTDKQASGALRQAMNRSTEDAKLARPTLKSVTGAVGYISSDGYSSKVTYGSRFTKTEPKDALMSIIYEATRVASLFGYGDEAVAEAEQAKKAVSDYFGSTKGLTHGTS